MAVLTFSNVFFPYFSKPWPVLECLLGEKKFQIEFLLTLFFLIKSQFGANGKAVHLYCCISFAYVKVKELYTGLLEPKCHSRRPKELALIQCLGRTKFWFPSAFCFATFLWRMKQHGRRIGRGHSFKSSSGALYPQDPRDYHCENKGFGIGIWGNILSTATLVCFPISVINTIQTSLGRKVICFTQPSHSLSLMEVRAGTENIWR